MVALPVSSDATPAGDDAPLVWVLHDGKAGMASQSLGLAEAAGFPFIEKALRVRHPWAWLPPQLWAAPFAAVSAAGRPLAAPWPDVVIACGRNAAMPALAIRRASRGKAITVQIQDPRVGHNEFDLMIVPEHDGLRRVNVITSKGALNRVTAEKLAAERKRFPELAALPRPVLGVLIGGSNRAYRLTLERIAEIAEAIGVCVRRSGGSVVLTASRRTGEEGIALLRQRLAELPASIWDMTGDNPYYAYLANADAFLVTADSVSMVSEAAATGKPVHIIDLAGGDRKFDRFHETMHAAGITRPFNGEIEDWSYAPLDDTARAAAALRVLVSVRQRARSAA
jgi:mitochondrial fission protein ELM1